MLIRKNGPRLVGEVFREPRESAGEEDGGRDTGGNPRAEPLEVRSELGELMFESDENLAGISLPVRELREASFEGAELTLRERHE